MFFFFWVLLRVTLIFGTLFALPLLLVVRAMARQVRDGRPLVRNENTAARPYGLDRRVLGAAMAILATLGARHHQWTAAIIGCGIVLGLSRIARWNKARSRAISWSLRILAVFDKGAETEDVWFRAAVAVLSVLLLDTFITGEWRFSPGLAIALVWCVCWAFVTRHFRHRAAMQAHFNG